MKKLKNFMILAISFAMVCMVSCKPEPTPEPIKNYDFDSVILEDRAVIDNMIETQDSVLFYESQVVFDGSIDTMKDANILAITNVYQWKDICITIEHNRSNIGMPGKITLVRDFWMEDMKIESIPVNFDSAWYNLKHAEGVELPMADKMVLRRPLYPPFDEFPSYIFGTRGTHFVRVYSGDGTVELY